MADSAVSSLRPRDVVERLIQSAGTGAIEDIADLYAPDVVIDIPFCPPGVPRRREGRETIREGFKSVEGLWRFERPTPSSCTKQRIRR